MASIDVSFKRPSREANRIPNGRRVPCRMAARNGPLDPCAISRDRNGISLCLAGRPSGEASDNVFFDEAFGNRDTVLLDQRPIISLSTDDLILHRSILEMNLIRFCRTATHKTSAVGGRIDRPLDIDDVTFYTALCVATKDIILCPAARLDGDSISLRLSRR